MGTVAFPDVPGVKINEVLLGAPPIAGVGTSTAAFVGVAPNSTADTVNKAIKITSFDQFIQTFALESKKSTDLSRAVQGFFTNGGGVCYVADVGAGGKLTDGVALLAPFDDINMIAAPGSVDDDVRDALIAQATQLGDRVALLDPPDASAVKNLDQLTTPKGSKDGAGNMSVRPSDSIWAAFYYPRVMVGPGLKNSKGETDDKDSEPVSPIGHIAGVYAQVDNSRGVHKAPANVALLGVQGAQYTLTDAEQEILNPEGVNALRVFGGNVVIWGARTLQPSKGGNTLFRYISTRRFATYVEQSLKAGLRWAVFEPNNLALRQLISRAVKGFLDGVFRDGALFGASPEEAYYIRFPEPFNRDEDRLQGKLTVEIGLRPAPPAEFIIIRIGILTQSAASA
jgi:phage tail sheath protein FI